MKERKKDPLFMKHRVYEWHRVWNRRSANAERFCWQH